MIMMGCGRVGYELHLGSSIPMARDLIGQLSDPLRRYAVMTRHQPEMVEARRAQ